MKNKAKSLGFYADRPYLLISTTCKIYEDCRLYNEKIMERFHVMPLERELLRISEPYKEKMSRDLKQEHRNANSIVALDGG